MVPIAAVGTAAPKNEGGQEKTERMDGVGVYVAVEMTLGLMAPVAVQDGFDDDDEDVFVGLLLLLLLLLEESRIGIETRWFEWESLITSAFGLGPLPLDEVHSRVVPTRRPCEESCRPVIPDTLLAGTIPDH